MSNQSTPTPVNLSFAFAEHENRRVEADFSGGHLSRDGGALLLRELDRRLGFSANSGFCREPILAWCEAHGLFYAIGLARNSRLLAALADALFDARLRACLCGAPTRTFTSFAYLLIVRLREQALQGTMLASATAGTIRLKRFKIAAHITFSCRRIYIRLASAFPGKTVFAQACQALGQLHFSTA